MTTAQRNNLVTAFAALGHPTRLDIILEGLATEESFSASDYAKMSGQPVPRVGYHFKVLREAGYLRVTKRRKRRGATETYCVPTAAARKIIELVT